MAAQNTTYLPNSENGIWRS